MFLQHVTEYSSLLGRITIITERHSQMQENLNFRYCDHRSLPYDSVLSDINQFYTFASSLFRIHLKVHAFNLRSHKWFPRLIFYVTIQLFCVCYNPRKISVFVSKYFLKITDYETPYYAVFLPSFSLLHPNILPRNLFKTAMHILNLCFRAS